MPACLPHVGGNWTRPRLSKELRSPGLEAQLLGFCVFLLLGARGPSPGSSAPSYLSVWPCFLSVLQGRVRAQSLRGPQRWLLPDPDHRCVPAQLGGRAPQTCLHLPLGSHPPYSHSTCSAGCPFVTPSLCAPACSGLKVSTPFPGWRGPQSCWSVTRPTGRGAGLAVLTTETDPNQRERL